MTCQNVELDRIRMRLLTFILTAAIKEVTAAVKEEEVKREMCVQMAHLH